MITFDYTNSQPGLLQNAQNLVTNTVNQFIVRPFGNPNLTGVSGFKFDILEDEEIVIESLITDNYVEANYAVQDHIALKPLRFTLKGYVGELVDDTTNQLAQLFIATAALPLVSSFAPQFTLQASQVYSKINQVTNSVQNIVNQAQSLYSLFTGSATNANKQQNGFQYFYQLWQTRQLVSVETPFGKFDNMAIESVRALQTGATREVSDFTVSFKQIRVTTSVSNNIESFAQNLGTSSTEGLFTSGRLQGLTAFPVDLGPGSGNPVDTSLTFSGFTNKT